MSKQKILLLCGIWIGIFGLGVIGYRYIVKPRSDKQAAAKQEEEQKLVLEQTSSQTKFDHHLTLNLDSFSGYAVVRSDAFREELARRKIGLELVDDGADYNRRLADLESGKAQMGVFTIDALIKASDKLGRLPATILFLIDESRGADAMIGVSRTLPNIDALNDPNTKFVVVPDSPSETLARVVMASFNLDRLSPNPWVYANSAKDIYSQYQVHQPNDKNIFVLWEPYISKMSQNPDYKIIADSSKFRGYIVDVMVVQRSFLIKNPKVVREATQAYFTAVFESSLKSKMSELVLEDSVRLGEPLKPDEVKGMVGTNGDKPPKIWFKNMRENYSHFGIRSESGLQHIEDIIANITKVLLKTKAIKVDPTDSKPNLLYYKNLLTELANEDWHPGASEEGITAEGHVLTLSEEDWTHLETVGKLEVPNLVFARGTSRLTETSRAALTELAEKLKTFPHYYVSVRGDADRNGDLEANKKLALTRAEAAKEFLTQAGIASNRIRVIAGEPSGETVVSFVVGQLPY